MDTKDISVAITGIGIITPAVNDIATMASWCSKTDTMLLKKVETIPSPPDMNSRELRRMAPLTRLALFASDKALQGSHFNKKECGLLIGLTHGSTSLLKEFHDFLFDYGPQMASPNAFSNGVTNAPLGALSKNLGLIQGGGTLVGYENCGMLILDRAARFISQGTYESCCIGAAEEYSEIVEGAYKPLRWYNGKSPAYLPFPLDYSNSIRNGFILSEASVFFTMTTKKNALKTADKGCCFFSPVDDLKIFDKQVDLIISGAGGGPQDEYELSALQSVLLSQKNPPALLFSKPFFGETFAAGALLSSAIAYDILVNNQKYPSFPVHSSLKNKVKTGDNPDFSGQRSILVIAAGRDKQVHAGLFTKNSRIVS